MELLKKIFPKTVLKREIEVLRLQNLKRAYEAGQPLNFHKTVIAPNASPNTNMEYAGERMRARARYFDENLDIVTGLFDSLETNVVGNMNPIRPLVRNLDGSLNSTVNTHLLQLWRQWGLSPTVCNQYTVIQALKLACRSWLRDGEYLTRLVRGSLGNMNRKAVPLSLELIEADYLPYNKDRQEKGKSPIIQGVEFNAYNQVLGYHLLKDHPENSLYGIKTDETKRIKAADILHLKHTKRTHQVRGVTLLHSVMNRLDDLKDYEESERIAARVAAALTGYIKKPGEGMGKIEGTDRTFEMSPGMVFDNLLPGEEVGTIASNRPNPELINFRSAMLRAVAAGTKTNYSTISRDYNGTYSSQRQELLESKPGYEGFRQQFVDSYLGPIWREFIKMGLAAGTIKTEGVDENTLDHIEIRGIDIGWIDPQKQANATETAIKTGVTTRGQVIRDQGGDPAATFAEIEEEKKIFGELEPTTDNNTQGVNDGSEEQEDD